MFKRLRARLHANAEQGFRNQLWAYAVFWPAVTVFVLVTQSPAWSLPLAVVGATAGFLAGSAVGLLEAWLYRCSSLKWRLGVGSLIGLVAFVGLLVGSAVLLGKDGIAVCAVLSGHGVGRLVGIEGSRMAGFLTPDCSCRPGCAARS